MNREEIIAGLRAHLADKEDIASSAAPALALMRWSLVELEKPTSNDATSSGSAGEMRDFMLKKELESAERTIADLRDTLSDREGFLYALLAEIGIVPEVDDEPVSSLVDAIQQKPTILEDLQAAVVSLVEGTDENPEDRANRERFIEGVRQLLSDIAPHGTEGMPLQDLWNTLETAANRYTSQEAAIIERDKTIEDRDRLIQAIRSKLGIPQDLHNTGEIVELSAINLLIEQRQAAQDRLLVGRDEEPAEGTLEAIIEQICTIMQTDWQDVETLPQEIQQLRDDANRMLREANRSCAPLEGWVSDAVDLAHAVRGNLAPENRVMAKAAEAIILGAPRGAE